MPIYEYGCEKCGAVSETILPVNRRDKPRRKCACGGKLKRMMPSTVQLRFGGSGTRDSDLARRRGIQDLSDHPDARRILGTGCSGKGCEV
jgi:putative FmdB family regulatory protein